jgi:isoquinoline 1-oxidoreductase alpha subunit
MLRKLTINGTVMEFDAEDDTPLLWVLRDTLGMNGTKFGCGVMACGACTVLVDGVATKTCGLPVSALSESQNITTIEGLPGASLHPVQKAWAANNVAQCGYCQAGMILAAVAMLEKVPNPSDADIERHMTNICRCGTYQLVRVAIKQAAREMQHG